MKMNKKLLLTGCIGAVVIIVLASFTTVVGFQTVKSNSVKASPLFSIRTKRAINEQQDTLNCDYVGKGKPTLITIPKRDNRIELIQRFIDSFSRMDNERFNRLIDFVTNRLQYKNGINDETCSEIVTLLEQLRNEPMKPENYRIFQKTNSDNGYNTYSITYCSGGVCPTSNPPFCMIVLYLFAILVLILDIFVNIFG